MSASFERLLVVYRDVPLDAQYRYHPLMRFSFVIRVAMIWAVCLCSAQGDAESLPESGMPLSEYLEQIRVDGRPIVFSSSLVTDLMWVYPREDSAVSLESLTALLSRHDLDARVQFGSIFVVPAQRSGEHDDSNSLQIHAAGLVQDMQTNEPIIGATVRIPSLNLTQITDDSGTFLFQKLVNVPEELIVEATGYLTHSVTMNRLVQGSLVQVVKLDRVIEQLRLDNLEVHTSRYVLDLQTGVSETSISHDELQLMPSLGREPLRSLSRLPGAASTGFSAKTHIRGGEQDEVLVLFDGMPLFEPFHLKDFQSMFSMIDARAVEGIDTYTGGFPANYGDRLSAVIDVQSLQATGQYPREAWLDLFHAGSLLSGTIATEGNWLITARRGNLDQVIDTLDPDFGEPNYSDFYSSIRLPLTDTMTLSGSFLYGEDKITLTPEEERAEARYLNRHAWLSFEHLVRSNLSYQTLFGSAEIRNRRVGRADEIGDTVGFLIDKRDYSVDLIKQDWQYDPSDRLRFRWGLDIRNLRARYDFQSEVLISDDLLSALGEPFRAHDIQVSPSGHQTSAYLSSWFQLTEDLATEIGVRWDRHDYAPSSNEVSPRVSVGYQLRPETSIRASWGRFSQAQGIDELQVEDGVSEFFQPQRSDHAIVGVEHQFKNGWMLRMEAYEKTMNNLRPRYENLFDSLQLLPELQVDRIRVAPERAEAFGVEATLSGQTQGHLTDWWININRAQVDDWIDGVRTPRSWDQAQSAGFGMNWQFNRWGLNVAGRYHSGWPTTAVSYDGETLQLGPRNKETLPSFLSFDTRLSYQLDLTHGRLTTYFELTNLLDEANPCCVGYDLELDDDGQLFLERELDDGLPITPNIGVVWEF